ncbi:hypothetical protein GIB67_015494 [Kingdonia uniflora]|uniref:C2 domain-containing protein n=1 Tax=Kingdonia uniflora TaxID=39325 RepID=A0A7J7LA62_9MAGN|nr:hypothetical protein GIB67_015494 [Kingdonia uniflora]
MVEFIGLLKIKVIKGTNLAVRDMRSSDPYVLLTLGQQKVQTQVVQSNLNPMWNEELMLSVPQWYGALKLGYFSRAKNLASPLISDYDEEEDLCDEMIYPFAGIDDGKGSRKFDDPEEEIVNRKSHN